VGVYTRHEPSDVITGFDGGEFDAEGRWAELRFDTPRASCPSSAPISPADRQAPSGRRPSTVFWTDLSAPDGAQGRARVHPLRRRQHRPPQNDLKNWRSNQKNSGFLPEERAWMTRLLTEGGLVDVYRRLQPETTDACYTWWSNRGQAYAKNVGWRLDYHLATPALAVQRMRAQYEAIYKRWPRSSAGPRALKIPSNTRYFVAIADEVHGRHPGIELELTEELTGNLLRQLRAGQIQLAVLFDDGHLDGLSVTPVLSEQLCLIEPAAARTARCRGLSLRRALAEPLILPAQPHGVRPIIESAAAAAGLPPPQVYADISSISILRTTLLAGLGRTLLPVMPLQAEIASGQLRATPVTSPRLERVLTLCASAHIPRSAACQAVAEMAVALMQRLARDGEWVGARVL
jgi:LysR family transcriptional regulator, nitrogen assimilation regulatory protein